MDVDATANGVGVGTEDRPSGGWTRRRIIVALVVLTLVGSAATALRPLIRFDARRAAVDGLPFDLLVQPGVTDGEVAAVEAGLRAADQHLRSVVGQGVDQRVEVRLARTRGCKLFDSPAGPPTAWAEARIMCVNTRAPAWRSQFREDPALAAMVVAHEHVHNLQGQLGCLRDPGEHEYQWLIEGTAVHLGFQAMVTAGRWPDTAAGGQMRRWGVANADIGPLREYERSSGGDGAYALFHLATRYLDAEAPRPDALVEFCRRVGQGTGWRDAFVAAFGLPVDDFYARFERERPGLIGALR